MSQWYNPNLHGLVEALSSVLTNSYSIPFGSSGNLSNVSGSLFSLSNESGFAGIGFYLNVPTSGEVTFEGSFDNQNWSACTLRRLANDGYVQTTTVTDNYIGSIAGLRAFRVRMSLSGVTSGTIAGTLQRYVNTLEGIENGPPNDFELNMAEGKIAGYSIVNKFGRNIQVDVATVPEDVWDGGTSLGLYRGFPTGDAETVQCFSSNAFDISTGVGAREISINGLDVNYVQQQELISLSGTSPKTSLKSWRRVNSASITTAGISGYNVGEITCRHTVTTGDIFFKMPVGTNQTYVCAYTVPANKTAYIKKIFCGINRGTGVGAVSDREADVSLAVRLYTGVFRLRRPTNFNNNSDFNYEVYGGLTLPEKTDVTMRCTSVSTDATDVSAGFDLVLVDN